MDTVVKRSKARVLVAMSGGVDSSLAVALLQAEGYDVFGVTMRLSAGESDEVDAPHKTCCAVEGADDARRVCAALGVPHYVLNFEREFRRHVIDYFVAEYEHGRTPNPCLACNQYVKFDFLLRRAAGLQADYLATGHYARVAHYDGIYHLLKAADPEKDQSYFLYTLGQAELARLLLPIGAYRKPEIRARAAELGLPVATKPDSQDVCFIPGGDYRAFLAERLPARPGAIRDSAGNLLGRHQGAARYTVGQRRGLGIAAPQPLYVVGIDAAANVLTVGPDTDLQRDELLAERVHWVSGQPPELDRPVTAKIRYRSPEAPATVTPLPEGRARVRFAAPQRAIAPGQAVVFYAGEEVLGGGIIAGAPAALPGNLP
jgi:tRNA-specific 2-thiouridylase